MTDEEKISEVELVLAGYSLTERLAEAILPDSPLYIPPAKDWVQGNQDNVCNARCDYICTREPRHKGFHIGHMPDPPYEIRRIWK
jgi:hypothetical protein